MHFRTRLALLLAAGASTIAMSSMAVAAEYSAGSKVDAVTVFPSEAGVTRVAKVTVEDGEHVVRLSGLPLRLDRESVRVTAAAPFAVELGAVDLKPTVPAPIPIAARSEIEKKIAALTADLEAEKDKARVGEIQLQLIDRLGNAAGDGLTRGFADGKAQAELIGDLVAAAAKGSASALADIRASAARQRDIEIEIANLRKSIEQAPKPDAPSLDAFVNLVAKGKGEITLRIEYRVAGAGWQPVYEARLSTGSASDKPAIDFATRAAVRQNTGEAWDNVALTLSTARVSRGTAAPVLPALVGQFFQAVPRPMATMEAPMLRQKAVGMAAPAPASAPVADAEPAAPPPVEATEAEASAEANGTTIVYRLPGRATVMSGPDTRTLKVASDRIEPALTLKAVPKITEAAYLTASFAKGGEAALLPGRVSLYRDGVYVGQGRLPFVAAGDQVKLGFGEDERIKVTMSPVKQVDGEAGTFTSYKTTRTDTKITVRNLGAIVANLTVEDQIPVSENTDIKIEALPSNTPGAKADADGRRGVFAWTFDLKPGETRDLRTGWQARWPADKRVIWANEPK